MDRFDEVSVSILEFARELKRCRDDISRYRARLSELVELLRQFRRDCDQFNPYSAGPPTQAVSSIGPGQNAVGGMPGGLGQLANAAQGMGGNPMESRMRMAQQNLGGAFGIPAGGGGALGNMANAVQQQQPPANRPFMSQEAMNDPRNRRRMM